MIKEYLGNDITKYTLTSGYEVTLSKALENRREI